MRLIVAITTALSLAVITGCTTPLTPAMEAVRSTDGKGCEFVRSDTFSVHPSNISRYLKSRTHNLGGNAYKVISTTNTGIGTTINSEVYRCDFPATAKKGEKEGVWWQ